MTRKLLLFTAGALWGSLVYLALQKRRRPIINPDQQLAERVRSEVRIKTSHPELIRVSAKAGRVELKGPILIHEIARLIAAVRAIPAVDTIDDDLEAHFATREMVTA